jgi:hypothetical protein
LDSLAARCVRLHEASERGDPWAERTLFRAAQRGPRAAQALIDLTMEWHRHPGALDPCEDPGCAEALSAAVWAVSWEAWWPPGGKPPEHQRVLRVPGLSIGYA